METNSGKMWEKKCKFKTNTNNISVSLMPTKVRSSVNMQNCFNNLMISEVISIDFCLAFSNKTYRNDELNCVPLKVFPKYLAKRHVKTPLKHYQ